MSGLLGKPGIHGDMRYLRRAPKTTEFLANGVFTPDPEAIYAIADLQGGGASGASVSAPGANTGAVGAGGASGSRVRVLLSGASLITRNVIIGQGGVAVPGNAVAAGGNTVLQGAATANGGGAAANAIMTITDTPINQGALLMSNTVSAGAGFSILAGTDLGSQDGRAGERATANLSSGGTPRFVSLKGGQGGDTSIGQGGFTPPPSVAINSNSTQVGGAAAANTGAGGAGGWATGTSSALGGNGGSGRVRITEYF